LHSTVYCETSTQSLSQTSSSAIADKPRCRVGLAKSGKRYYSADNISLSLTSVT